MFRSKKRNRRRGPRTESVAGTNAGDRLGKSLEIFLHTLPLIRWPWAKNPKRDAPPSGQRRCRNAGSTTRRHHRLHTTEQRKSETMSHTCTRISVTTSWGALVRMPPPSLRPDLFLTFPPQNPRRPDQCETQNTLVGEGVAPKAVAHPADAPRDESASDLRISPVQIESRHRRASRRRKDCVWVFRQK